MLQKRETTINVRTAIEMLTGSWNDIQRSTVTGSFRKGGFGLQEEDEEEDVADEDLQCAVEPESWPLIQRRFGESGTFLNFVEADNNLAVAEDLSDESIIRMVQEGEQEEDTDMDVSDSEDSTPPMTSGEVMTVLGKVRKQIQLWPSGHDALDLADAATCARGMDSKIAAARPAQRVSFEMTSQESGQTVQCNPVER
ncbi:hypothetical protein HPB52_009428 [Rhipicephalus sanguineus]|uniref:Uncharacterized protein n=1 Tax=Rhipicephalus sanguineus TaxID=34632 RepID=A0A9D4PDU9_RHISA|nr:hypothetical protein HPB52_009428 [Rhipicephalus sanguineus]